MGLFNGFSNQASELTAKQIYLEYNTILLEEETVEKAVKVDKDKFIFTNFRLLLICYCKGDKFEFMSVPYSSIRKFSIVGKSINDSAGELIIYLLDEDKPIKKVLNNIEILNEVYKILSQCVFGQSSFAKELAVVKMN